MLKLYIKTIIACISGTILSVFVSALCLASSHELATYLQNYAIGMACSLVVVILTTWLQYVHEYERIYGEYCEALQNLILSLSVAYHKTEEIKSEEFFQKMRENLSEKFDKFQVLDQQLFCIKKKKQKQQERIANLYGKMFIDFLRGYCHSEKEAVCSLSLHKNYLELVNVAEEMIDNDFLKKMVKDCKEVAMGRNEKTLNNNEKVKNVEVSQ